MKLRNALVTFAIVTLSPVVWANETYKFDPSGSTIGFTVHQFLGTTHGKFTSFSGKIDIDRQHRYAHQKTGRPSSQSGIL